MKYFFQKLLMWALLGVLFASCVSKKYYLTQTNIWKKEINDKQAEISRLEENYNLKKDSLSKLEDENSKYLRQLSEAHNASEILKFESASLQAKLKEATKLAESLKSDYSEQQLLLQNAYAEQSALRAVVELQNQSWKALEEPIRKAFEDFGDNSVNLTREGNRLKLSIQDKILFKSGSVSIDNNAEKALTNLAGLIKDKEEINLIIEGHTDNVPIAVGSSFNDNWELSADRARSVNSILTRLVNPQRIMIAGRGEFAPVASNETPEGRSLNRRTEIYFEVKNEELELLISDIVAKDTRAKVITNPSNIEKYLVDRRSWVNLNLDEVSESELLGKLRKNANGGFSWRINTGNNFFQAKVREHFVVVVYSDKPIVEKFNLVLDEAMNLINIEAPPK